MPPMRRSFLASIRRTRCALKAPITTPVGKGFRSVNVQLRQEFELYACVRPCKTYQGVRSFFTGVPIDLVLVRENTEDLYAGIEFEAGAPKTAELTCPASTAEVVMDPSAQAVTLSGWPSRLVASSMQACRSHPSSPK